MKIGKTISASALVGLLIVLGAPWLDAQGKMQERLDTSATVLQELIEAPDSGIREDYLKTLNASA